MEYDKKYSKNFDIIISRFGRDYKKGTKDHITYNCPFCENKRGKADLDHKLYINYISLKFYCFKCHSHGRLSNKILNSSFGVYNNLINYANTDDDEDSDDQNNMFYLPNIKIPDKSVAFDYCNSRGITRDMIDFYNIRLGIDNLFGRIVVPNIIYTDSGVWTDMFSARSYLNQTPKYKNPDGCKKTNSVFNLHNISKGSDIYVVEGAVTAIHAGRTAVAVYGCHPSDQQINAILDKNPKNLYCVLDNDEAGRGPNEELAEVTSRRCDGNVYLVYMPKGKDAADMGETRFKEYVEDTKILYHSSVYTRVASYFTNN